MARVFEEWLDTFKEKISDYEYYVDFEKVHDNVQKIKVELNILNSLIGSKDIKKEFLALLAEYPKTLQCIPILLAVREKEIYAIDGDGEFTYQFKKMNYTPEQYAVFMEKTGLFDLLQNHLIHNLIDYVTGVETGLSSNGRKNRGGHLMEDLVESYIQKAGFEKGKTYFKEMKLKAVEETFGVDLSLVSNAGKTVKRFDFVLYANGIVYGVETNFYASNGSKLNETARSYKQLALESAQIEGFEFVWFTDGKGWHGAKNNLRETFEVMQHLYNITELDSGILNLMETVNSGE